MLFARKRIVYVVDDDADVRDSTTAVLKVAGFESRPHSSGDKFLAAVEASSGGCVLLDLHMPIMSGWQVLQKLQEGGNTIPVIIVSGCSDNITDERVRKMGAAAFIAKPFPPSQLIDLVRRLFDEDGAG